MRLLVLSLCLILPGCASYSVASIGTLITTGKSLGDHATSGIAGGDCDLIRAVREVSYYCEMPVVYNQSGL